jgi:hypothetical protein
MTKADLDTNRDRLYPETEEGIYDMSRSGYEAAVQFFLSRKLFKFDHNGNIVFLEPVAEVFPLCLGCEKPFDPDHESISMFRPECRTYCSMTCRLNGPAIREYPQTEIGGPQI